MTPAFNACANCLHFEGDTETVRRFLQGRLQEVYLHRCRKHPAREDAGAVHEESFVSRAEAEFKANGFDKPVGRIDGLIQGELF
ncbi:MAG: hypothetical protein WCK89_14405 [bacterium]